MTKSAKPIMTKKVKSIVTKKVETNDNKKIEIYSDIFNEKIFSKFAF